MEGGEPGEPITQRQNVGGTVVACYMGSRVPVTLMGKVPSSGQGDRLILDWPVNVNPDHVVGDTYSHSSLPKVSQGVRRTSVAEQYVQLP